MHRIASIALLAGLMAPLQAERIPSDFSLTSDHRSRRVDDVVTVLVEEDNTARNAAQTSTQSESNGSISMQAGSGMLGFIPDATAKSALGADFKGAGNTSRAGSMQAVVSARVIEVLPNGSLRIEGSKQVIINDETEILTVAGLLRPEDIGSDNTVNSGRLADAKVAYNGRGADAEAARKGPIARFLDWIF